MKTLTWFTHTNIDTRKIIHQPDYFSKSPVSDSPSVSFDLSEFIQVFKENEIWKRKKYRSEYNQNYDNADFEKIKSVKIHLHSKNCPYSNCHNYQDVLKSYINLENFEYSKIASSGISEASQIAVVVVEFDSENKVIDYLTYEEEKDVETVFEKRLSEQNVDSWYELKRIKSVVCEFIQFFSYNLHLNFLTHNYEFSFTDKPNLIGFTTITEGDNFYYETDKIDFFAHYVFYDKEQDNLQELMRLTSKFWHREIPSIHFFLDALKGNFITATNFIKLVFTVESFFGFKTSNDYMTLTLPLVLCTNIRSMKSVREILKTSFDQRNNIVHGSEIYELREHVNNKPDSKSIAKLFFELKNVIIQTFYFYINEGLYLSKNNEKINHELIFRLLPNGITKKKIK
jgi:hypothetical protein